MTGPLVAEGAATRLSEELEEGDKGTEVVAAALEAGALEVEDVGDVAMVREDGFLANCTES